MKVFSTDEFLYDPASETFLAECVNPKNASVVMPNLRMSDRGLEELRIEGFHLVNLKTKVWKHFVLLNNINSHPATGWDKRMKFVSHLDDGRAIYVLIGYQETNR